MSSEYATFKVVRYTPRADGKTTATLQCECGHRNLVHIWSWGGHGFFRCRACFRKLRYMDLMKAGDA